MTENEKKDTQGGTAENETGQSGAKKPEQRTKNKRGLIQAIVVIAVVAAIGISAPKFLKKEVSFDQILLEKANAINATLPRSIDSATVLNSVAATPGKKFYYMYTLVNHAKDELNMERLETGLRQNILNSIKINPGLQEFRDNKVTMIYAYNDKNGEEVIVFEFTPEEYLQ